MTEKPILLDLCSGTGAWSEPWRVTHQVLRYDIEAGLDVRLLQKPQLPIDCILAAPPCTHFAYSGARWFKAKGDSALLEGLSVVDACLRLVYVSNPRVWCLENPQGRLQNYLGKPQATFDPCDYGDPYTKKTWLWGKFTMPEKHQVEPIWTNFIHSMPPGPDRTRRRSITPSGFAMAFYEANAEGGRS